MRELLVSRGAAPPTSMPGHTATQVTIQVPGHEAVGIVTEVGPDVTAFAVGDHVGVGNMVDSCLGCHSCLQGQPLLCSHSAGLQGFLRCDRLLARGGGLRRSRARASSPARCA